MRMEREVYVNSYTESVQWYFTRFKNRFIKYHGCNCPYTLESHNPGDGVRYYLNLADGSERISPSFKAREMKIWLDAQTTMMYRGLILKR